MTRRYRFEELADALLERDALYEGGTRGNVGDDPLQRLLPVGNAGGIRRSGSIEAPNLVVLYSTGNEPEWTDEIDTDSGRVRYHGDQRTAGDLLATSKRGNELFDRLAKRGFRESRADRTLPPFLVFTRADTSGPARSVTFRGVAFPGAPGLPEEDWLIAKWFRSPNRDRFLNYVLELTLTGRDLLTRSEIEQLITGDLDAREALLSEAAWLD